MTVIPRAFVKVGSLVKVLRGLSGKTRPGRGWSVSELGGEQWLSRGPRYFFAGQARRAGGGVTMEPFWVRVPGEGGFALLTLVWFEPVAGQDPAGRGGEGSRGRCPC